MVNNMKTNYREVPTPGSQWRENGCVIVTVSAATYNRVEFYAEGQSTRMLPARLFHARFNLITPAPAEYIQPQHAENLPPVVAAAVIEHAQHPIIARFNALRERVQQNSRPSRRAGAH